WFSGRSSPVAAERLAQSDIAARACLRAELIERASGCPPKLGGQPSEPRSASPTGRSLKRSERGGWFPFGTTPARQLLLSCRATPPNLGGEFSYGLAGPLSASDRPKKNFLPLANTMFLPTARVDPSFAW